MVGQEQVAVQKEKGTKINKIVMSGFKSFAKHTEVLFNGKYNCQKYTILPRIIGLRPSVTD